MNLKQPQKSSLPLQRQTERYDKEKKDKLSNKPIPVGEEPKKEKKMLPYLFQALVLPEHVIFYYKLSGSMPLALNLPLRANILGVYLSGRYKTSVNDPERSIQPGERQLEIATPYSARGGHPKLSTDIYCLEDGTAICVYPKDELQYIMHPDSVTKYTTAPPYTIIISAEQKDENTR